MKQTNLKKRPDLIEATIDLIEKSFEYNSKNSFKIDFYPLVNSTNFEHCHLLIDNNKVIGHIGRLQKSLKINNHVFNINMFGGIAIDEQFQGQGIFKEFFNNVLKRYPQEALNFLWSDKIDLYNKFNFHPCIEMFEYASKKSDINNHFEIKKIDLDIVSAHFSNNPYEIRFQRDSKDWKELSHITSCQVYGIYRESKLINYFIKDKGQDLTDIIHEYYYMDTEQLSVMRNYGSVWSSYQYKDLSPTPLFGALGQINNKKEFHSFINTLYNIDITDLNHSDNDLLQGFLGPGKFKEIESKYHFYFCGLETI